MGVEAVIATQIIDTTTVGRAVMTAADAAAARTAIGAGTSSFDGAYGSLSGIPSAFAPSSHAHGNITNAGAIGSTASLPIITGASGVLQVGSFGTTVGTFCQGNDSRLSDARTPTAHTHPQSDVTNLVTDLAAKQATLVSGTNIKTVNSTSLLGSGDISVSASPAGSSGQVQFNNAGAFGGAAAVVYATTGTHVVVTAQGATIVPLCAKGAASQSANILEVQNSAGTKLFFVTPGGAIVAAGVAWTGKTYYQDGFSSVGWGLSSGNWYFGNGASDWKFGLHSSFGTQVFSGTLGFNNNSPGSASDAGVSRNAAGVIEINNGTAGTFRDLIIRNLGLNGAVSAGGGVGIAFIANATTVPTTNPTGGGVLYCEGGALKFRGSSGTVTTLGPA